MRKNIKTFVFSIIWKQLLSKFLLQGGFIIIILDSTWLMNEISCICVKNVSLATGLGIHKYISAEPAGSKHKPALKQPEILTLIVSTFSACKL